MSAKPRRTALEAGQESVWDYPRPPRVEDVHSRVQISVAHIVLADTLGAKRVLETSHPPVYYIPPDDIRMEYLRSSPGSTWCEWKGQADYYDLVLDDQLIPRVAWAYLRPRSGFEEIQDYLAFYPSKMEKCLVDAEIVRAQEGDFYGGWITSNIVGPFKGGAGTQGW